MAIVKQWKGICTNLANNNNKFWAIELHDNGDVITRWGRVVEGAEEKAQSKTFSGAGESFYQKKLNEKQNKSSKDDCYTEVKTVGGGSLSGQGMPVQVTRTANILEVAKKEIATNSPETLKLIEYLHQKNVHNITSQTTLTFNKVSGLFETPLGVVTDDALVDARRLLVHIGDLVAARNYGDDFVSTVNKYMRLVPQDIGRRRVELSELYPDLNAVRRQNDILDSLEASLKMVMTMPADDAPKPAEAPRLFDAKLHVVEDGKTIDRIDAFYRQTKNQSHVSSGLRIKRVYEVEVGHMARSFQSDGAKLDNIWELWHGTRVGNLLSILKGGFIIPPSNASHCTGRMFGNGVYFSDQSTKSLNYAYGYWDGRGYDDNCFMFLNQVAMGNYYVPHGPTSSNPPRGYDSYFAEGRKSGVANNEMIVFRTSQINPCYLIQFGK